MTHSPIHRGETRGPGRLKANSPWVPQTCRRGAGKGGSRSWALGSKTHQCPVQPSPVRPLTRGLQLAAAHQPAATDRMQTTHRVSARPAKRGRARTAAAWKGLYPGPSPAPAGPPRPAPSGRLRTCTARTRPLPVSWPCRSCSRILPGRGRPPHPPQAATVAAALRPRPAPDPGAAGAAAISPPPTNRKQAAPGPRRFLRGGGGGRRSAPSGSTAETQAAWQGCERRAGAAGKCSLALRLVRCERAMWRFLCHLFFGPLGSSVGEVP